MHYLRQIVRSGKHSAQRMSRRWRYAPAGLEPADKAETRHENIKLVHNYGNVTVTKIIKMQGIANTNYKIRLKGILQFQREVSYAHGWEIEEHNESTLANHFIRLSNNYWVEYRSANLLKCNSIFTWETARFSLCKHSARRSCTGCRPS